MKSHKQNGPVSISDEKTEQSGQVKFEDGKWKNSTITPFFNWIIIQANINKITILVTSEQST